MVQTIDLDIRIYAFGSGKVLIMTVSFHVSLFIFVHSIPVSTVARTCWYLGFTGIFLSNT